jgi:hypothetical protein
MRGRPWSKEICEVVVRAAQLGVGHTVTEATTGVSKRGIQRIIAKSKNGDEPHQRRKRKKLLGDQHRDVSRGWDPKQLFAYSWFCLVSERLSGAQPLCSPQ